MFYSLYCSDTSKIAGMSLFVDLPIAEQNTRGVLFTARGLRNKHTHGLRL